MMSTENVVHNIETPLGALIKVAKDQHTFGKGITLQIVEGDRFVNVIIDDKARGKLVEALRSYDGQM